MLRLDPSRIISVFGRIMHESHYSHPAEWGWGVGRVERMVEEGSCDHQVGLPDQLQVWGLR